MAEFLYSFVRPSAPTPYYISLAGVTYPDPHYHLNQQNRSISVIEYVTDGKGYVLIDGDYREVKADTIYFLNEGENHEYFADKKDPFTKIFLNISGPFAGELPSLYAFSNKQIFENKKLRKTFEKIPQILRSSQNEEDMQIALQVVLCEILTTLSYHQGKQHMSEDILKLKKYIDSNSHRIVPNAELANRIFRSVDYCQKLFLKELGITPYAYQINRKIAVAKNLLTNTNLSVAAIGAFLGYNDPHYFSNFFKSKTGYSPSDYKNQHT